MVRMRGVSTYVHGHLINYMDGIAHLKFCKNFSCAFYSNLSLINILGITKLRTFRLVHFVIFFETAQLGCLEKNLEKAHRPFQRPPRPFMNNYKITQRKKLFTWWSNYHDNSNNLEVIRLFIEISHFSNPPLVEIYMQRVRKM